MPFEDDLGAALRRTGDTFGTDSRALVAAGLIQGRSLRRRRTAAVTGTVAAVVAAGVTAGLVLPGGTTQKAGPAATSTPDPARTSKGKGGRTISDAQMLGLFEQLLPKGEILSGRASGTRHAKGRPPAPYAEVVWDDGDGASTISIGFNRVEAGQSETECPDLAFMKQGTTCTRTELPGKSVLVIVKGWEYQDSRQGPKSWRATLTTRDGRQIMADEWNAPAEKGKPTTRENPPLSADQLGALVRAPQWEGVFADFPVASGKAARPGSVSAEPGGDAIVKVLTSALPQGLKVSAMAGESGYAHVTVDDGHGATFVEVNVQRWAKKNLKDLRFPNPTILPDGTKVVTRQGGSGEPGVVQWTADTLRPDGLRVVISELNSGGYHRPPTRSAPALDMDALVAAATDAKWKTFG
ncbi:hypothetical protein [Actinacidiphila sp. bgisy160]|uniref:hypothetical protein n=1 Tax=Actinacidiphila sp. bgisy160 TaxID=3413796 RepID=UPI003D75DFC8